MFGDEDKFTSNQGYIRHSISYFLSLQYFSYIFEYTLTLNEIVRSIRLYFFTTRIQRTKKLCKKIHQKRDKALPVYGAFYSILGNPLFSFYELLSFYELKKSARFNLQYSQIYTVRNNYRGIFNFPQKICVIKTDFILCIKRWYTPSNLCNWKIR